MNSLTKQIADLRSAIPKAEAQAAHPTMSPREAHAERQSIERMRRDLKHLETEADCNRQLAARIDEIEAELTGEIEHGQLNSRARLYARRKLEEAAMWLRKEVSSAE